MSITKENRTTYPISNCPTVKDVIARGERKGLILFAHKRHWPSMRIAKEVVNVNCHGYAHYGRVTLLIMSQVRPKTGREYQVCGWDWDADSFVTGSFAWAAGFNIQSTYFRSRKEAAIAMRQIPSNVANMFRGSITNSIQELRVSHG